MGTFAHPIEVAGSREGSYVTVDAIVDTGATYTQLPRSLVSRLGVHPTETAEFTLADGGRVRRELAEVFVRLDGRIRSTLCVVADDHAPVLLGAYTLEGFGLTVDPVNKRLTSTTLYLLGSCLEAGYRDAHGAMVSTPVAFVRYVGPPGALSEVESVSQRCLDLREILLRDRAPRPRPPVLV